MSTPQEEHLMVGRRLVRSMTAVGAHVYTLSDFECRVGFAGCWRSDWSRGEEVNLLD